MAADVRVNDDELCQVPKGVGDLGREPRTARPLRTALHLASNVHGMPGRLRAQLLLFGLIEDVVVCELHPAAFVIGADCHEERLVVVAGLRPHLKDSTRWSVCGSPARLRWRRLRAAAKLPGWPRYGGGTRNFGRFVASTNQFSGTSTTLASSMITAGIRRCSGHLAPVIPPRPKAMPPKAKATVSVPTQSRALG